MSKKGSIFSRAMRDTILAGQREAIAHHRERDLLRPLDVHDHEPGPDVVDGCFACREYGPKNRDRGE